MKTAEIRRLRADEWDVLRKVRLSALAESPDAFATTWEEASARPEGWWREWAERSASGAEQAMFLAWDGGSPVGIVGAFRDEGDCHVISMWVDPGARGRGLGLSLLEAAVRFAGGSEVVLRVEDGNAAARRLYERSASPTRGRLRRSTRRRACSSGSSGWLADDAGRRRQ